MRRLFSRLFPSGRSYEGVAADAGMATVTGTAVLPDEDPAVPVIPYRAVQGGADAALVKAADGSHDMLIFHAGQCWRIDRAAAIVLHGQMDRLLWPTDFSRSSHDAVPLTPSCRRDPLPLDTLRGADRMPLPAVSIADVVPL